MPRCICIIPARGGSKRIPGKNLKPFLGKPIIAYSIEVALKSGLFSEVIVSTEDRKIAEFSKTIGASVPFTRSKENSDDYATLADVVDEVKESYQRINLNRPEYLCCLLPTAPFVTEESLKGALDILLQDSETDSVRPIVEFPYPIQRAFKQDATGFLSFFQDEFKMSRSQDLQKAYYDAGQFYFSKWEKGLRGSKKKGIEISALHAQDIDTPEDWSLAEAKYNFNLNG